MNIIIVLTGLFLIGNSEASPFSLHLSIDGDTFYPREPIYLKLVIKNINDRKHRLPNLDNYACANDFLYYTVVSHAGDTLPNVNWEILYIMNEGSLITLQPDDSTIIEIPLNKHCGVTEKVESNIGLFPLMIPPGNYTVKIKYKFRENAWPALKLWRGMVESNICKFSVVKITGKYEEAYELYRDFLTLLQTSAWKGKQLSKTAKFEQGVELTRKIIEFQIEPYSVLAQWYHAYQYGLQVFYDNQKYAAIYQEESKKIYEEHPDTKFARYNLEDYKNLTLKRLNRPEEWIPYLEYLSENYLGTFVGNKAEEFLEKEELR